MLPDEQRVGKVSLTEDNMNNKKITHNGKNIIGLIPILIL